MRTARHSLIGLVLALTVIACGPQSVTVTPQARVARYGASVFDAVTQVQTFVNEQTAPKGPLPEAAGRQVTDVNQRLVQAGRQLSDLLKTYDAATTLDARHLQEGQIQAVIATINTTLGEAFNFQIESPVGAQVAALYANVAKTVAALSAEIAKGWNTDGQ